MVNLELYKVFYTVAKCGSLTKAAEELYITQPAVSQAIKQLETQLGIPLFKRTRKGVELSVQGGGLVYADVERAMQILSGVEDKLSELKDSATGVLRIGVSESIFQYCLAEKISLYHELYPQVKIEIHTDLTIENLKTDRCDVGFFNLPIEEDKSILLTDTLTLLNDVFIAGDTFQSLNRGNLTLWELQRYPLILMQEHTIARMQFDHFCQGIGVKLDPAVEVDSWGCMKRLIAQGIGIGCLPREYAKDKLEDGSMFELCVTPSLPTRSIGMAISKNTAMSYALKAFINIIRKKG